MGSSLAIVTSTFGESPIVDRCIQSWYDDAMNAGHSVFIRRNMPEDNLGVTGSLQFLYGIAHNPIICFIHSDVEIKERGWTARVLAEFDDPKVGVVGFGGAKGHGEDEVYKTPYRLTQLRRIGYLSNVDDAEVHGERFAGSTDVAVLDGFVLVIRREILDRVGGWPVKELPFHNYDLWASVTAHKLGYRVRMIGIRAHHYGGTSSTTADYQKWSLENLGRTDQQVHEESHRWLYDYARGWLPWRCL